MPNNNNHLIRHHQFQQRQQQMQQQQFQQHQSQQQQLQYTQQQFQQQQQLQHYQPQQYTAADGAVGGNLIINQMSLNHDPIYLNELLSGLPVFQTQSLMSDPQYSPFRQWQCASSDWIALDSQNSPQTGGTTDILGPSYGPIQQGPFPRVTTQDASTTDVAKVVPQMVCGYCPSNAQIRCIDCSDVLCESCLNNHSMNPVTKDHCVVAIRSISPIGTSSGSASASPPIAPAAAIDVGNCGTHNEILRYVCEQCIVMVCQECTLWTHSGHSVVEIGEYSSLAVPKLRSAIEQARQGKQLVKNSIDRAVLSTQSIERDAAEVAQRIRKSIRNYITCLEEREKFLLEYLDSLRLTKVTALAEQQVGLRSTLSGLADQQITLQKTLENAHTINGGEMCTLLTENDRRQVEYAQMYYHLLPKDEYMAFVAPSNELMQEIRSHGDIQLIERPAVVTRSPPQEVTRRPRYISYQQPPSVKRPPAPFVDHESVFASIYPHLDPINENFPKDVIGQSIPGSNIYVTLKPTLKASKSFAIEGHADGQVSRPWGVCVDRIGRIIVADRRNHRIQIFDQNGVFLTKFGSQGFGNGQFELPAGITTDPDNRIVVVDKDNHRVQVFNSNGHFIFKFGSVGSESGQFQYPWGVAVNSRGDILISDTRNHRLQLFNKNGAFLARHNFDSYYYYRDLLGLVMPRGVCFLPHGKIIVSDFDNHRLLILNDNLAPRCLGVVGYDQNHWLEFSRPSGIVCDDAGRVIVADSKSQRVMIFSPALEFLYSVSRKI